MSGPQRTRIKFCGMTSAGDVALAVAAGADAVGIIVSASPRRVEPEALEGILAAVPPFVTPVVVCAGETAVDLAVLAARGVLLQFSGLEAPADCVRLARGAHYLKAFHVRVEDGSLAFDRTTLDEHPQALWLFDSSAAGRGGIGPQFGGTGRSFDWKAIAGLARERPIVVSGGLSAANVGDCVRVLRPYAVDVRNGIESAGRKDEAKMRAFAAAVRAADERFAAGAQTVAVRAATNGSP